MTCHPRVPGARLVARVGIAVLLALWGLLVAVEVMR